MEACTGVGSSISTRIECLKRGSLGFSQDIAKLVLVTLALMLVVLPSRQTTQEAPSCFTSGDWKEHVVCSFEGITGTLL